MPRPISLLALVLVAACGDDLVEPATPRASLDVAVVTTGEHPDPDGYLVLLDGGAGVSVASNGTVTFPAVAEGAHEVSLSGLSPNCGMAGDDPAPVTVGSDKARVNLEVRCGPPSGTIRVVTSTLGPRPDADGYVVVVNGFEYPLAANASVTVSGLPVGEIVVELTGAAPNCVVGGGERRTVPLHSGTTFVVTFEVTCIPIVDGLLLFSSTRSGVSHLYSIRDDGSELRDLTPSREAFRGDWSPDGTRIVFAAAGGLFVMRADGSAVAGLGVEGSAPRWSPDGRTILFDAGGVITVMQADGTGATALVEGGNATWSPDGRRVAFNRIDRTRCVAGLFCPSDLYIMAADGTDVTRLTTGSDASDQRGSPAWSPDGSTIAYARSCCFLGPDAGGLYVMSARGGLPIRVHHGPVRGGPVWSPDGQALAVAIAGPDGTTELTLLPARGGASVVLASSPGYEFPYAWR